LRLRKIIKIVATRCQILRLECTKFDFGWGSAPDPAGGAYSALPDALAGFWGLLLREGRAGGRGEGKGGETNHPSEILDPPLGIGPPEGLIRHWVG